MKYIVLSFDDGTIDFKKNALPILIHFGFTATINIVSGFVDGTVLVDKNTISKYSINPDLSFLTINDVSKLKTMGFEIANHTNSHVKNGSYEELKTCDEKIKIWCGTRRIGVVMPKYSKPSKSAKKYVKDTKSPYITYRDWKINIRTNFFKTLFWKVAYLAARKESVRLRYLVNHCAFKKGNCKKFLRISITNKTDPECLIESFSHIPDEYCLSLCFHSISNENPARTIYPNGCWTINKFETFCSLLSKHDEISIINQIDACC